MKLTCKYSRTKHCLVAILILRNHLKIARSGEFIAVPLKPLALKLMGILGTEYLVPSNFKS